MKANFDAGPFTTSYRFEITLSLLAIWILTGLAAWFDWLPVWVPIVAGPVAIINLVARRFKGDFS